MSSDRASSSTGRYHKNYDKTSDKSYEIFRNNTTSVEVIVKEVPKNHVNGHYTEITRLQQENRRLREDLEIAEGKIQSGDRNVSYVVFELKKQLDISNAREVEAQTENIELKLENEKLKTALQSKETYINKLKKELGSMRRMIKLVIKGILNAPTLPESPKSDPVYEHFEKDLLKTFNLNFPLKNSLEMTGFTDSSVMEDTSNLSSPPIEKK